MEQVKNVVADGDGVQGACENDVRGGVDHVLLQQEDVGADDLV